MMNIVLATDFSKNAKMAALHAAGLARHCAARLIIFHALDHGHESGEASKLSYMEPEELAQSKLDTLAAELQDTFNISISRLMKPGIAQCEILGLAEKTGADLLVMGAKGSGKPDGRVLGSVAGGLLLSSNIPLVCIPSDVLISLPEQLNMILKEKSEYCNGTGLKLLQQFVGQLGHNKDKPVMG